MGPLAGFVTTRTYPASVSGQSPHSSFTSESNHCWAARYCECSMLVSAIKTFTSSKFLRVKLFLLKLFHHFRCQNPTGSGKQRKTVWRALEFKILWRRDRTGFGFANQFVHRRTQRDSSGVRVIHREIMNIVIKRDRSSHKNILHLFFDLMLTFLFDTIRDI